MKTNHCKCLAGLLLSILVWASTSNADPAVIEESFTVSSLLGGANDSVMGVRIQADGSIVLAANVSAGPVAQLAGEGTDRCGMVVRLAPGGTKVISARRVGAEVRDLAGDGAGNLFVALGKEGVVKLDATGIKELWRKDTGGVCGRVDAAADGTCAALSFGADHDAKTGAGSVLVFAADGRQLGAFKGRHNTLDVAIDGASKTIITIGWRQANAHDGKRKEPVQISHLTGRAYDGTEKYHLYDWSVDPAAPNFINKPTNNMADTRGYRCSLGADGRLYTAFECAGGNHIFRYEPRLENGEWIPAKEKKAKGDAYHSFHNSKSEHKTYVGVYDPATGAFLRGQEITGRLTNGRANAVRVESGCVTGSADGVLLVGGTSAFGLPVSFLPAGTGDYTGGGFLLGLNPTLTKRDFCIRIQPGAKTHAVDIRKVGGKTVVAFAGSTSSKTDPFWTKNAVQSAASFPCGFFAAFTTD